VSAANAGPPEIFSAVAPLAEEPRNSAVFLDLDGTLAPIVERPEDAAVPGRTRELVERIASRYGLTAVVSGRQSLDARRILGLDQLAYVGNHGYELLAPGAEQPQPAPALAGHERDAEDPHEIFRKFSAETIANSDEYFAIPKSFEYRLQAATPNSPPSEGGVAAASADGVVLSLTSPPSEGGVAAVSADGVVLSLTSPPS
jgi:hypothetical protein